jgi:hypothetical protein
MLNCSLHALSPTNPTRNISERAADGQASRGSSPGLQETGSQARDAGRLRCVDVGLGSKHRAMRFAPADVDEYVANLTKRNTPQQNPPATRSRRRSMTSGADVIGSTARRLLKQKQKD